MRSEFIEVIHKNTDILSQQNHQEYQYIPLHDKPLPSVRVLKRIIDLLRSLVFPGYFGDTIVNLDNLKCHIGVELEELYILLTEQINHGICFDNPKEECFLFRNLSQEKAISFINSIPEIKRIISTDVKATFDSDPAAKSYSEVIFSYPTIKAVFNHRISHELLKLNVPVLPRIISELAHSETGIDINPGAQIGEFFSIDHGTGVVIGETTIIGNHVRIYQGVTLGAKRFEFDNSGNPINIPRHPIIEDNVVIYANANVLGRITIGKNSVIGGNVWLISSVPADSHIQQQKAISSSYYDGLGI